MNPQIRMTLLSDAAEIAKLIRFTSLACCFSVENPTTMLEVDVICASAALQRALPAKASKAKTAWVGTAGWSNEHILGSLASGSYESVSNAGSTFTRRCSQSPLRSSLRAS